MGCCHHYQFSVGSNDLFTVDVYIYSAALRYW